MNTKTLYKRNKGEDCPMCKKGKLIIKESRVAKEKYLGCDNPKCKFSQGMQDEKSKEK